MRKVSPTLASLSNFIGFGLGYIYLGRIAHAFAFAMTIFLFMAIVGWSEVVFQPGLFCAAVLVAMCIGLVPVFHCILIARRTHSAPAKQYNRWWFYLIWIVLSWVYGQLIIEARPALFGYEPYRVPAASMAPELQTGDYVMADTWRYKRHDPGYGELVVFRVPGNEQVEFAKRLVGLPGDTVELRNDALYRNGIEVREPYIQISNSASNALRNFGPVVVPENSYFFLGDNRHNSRDSRFFGPVSRDLLHGRVEHRWFSYDSKIRWDRFPQVLTADVSGS